MNLILGKDNFWDILKYVFVAKIITKMKKSSSDRFTINNSILR